MWRKDFIKRSKKGNRFYGCSNYPECNFVSWYEPTNEKCPECGSYMVKRYSKSKGEYLQCSDKECKYEKIIEKNNDENNSEK